MLASIRRVANLFEGLLSALVTLSMSIIAFTVVLAVFYRYVLASPLDWTNELAQLLLVLTVVLASAIGLRRRTFVAVRAVVDVLPPVWQRVVDGVVTVSIFIFLSVCVVSVEPMITRARITATISPALSLPMFLVYRVLQVGFGIMALFVLFGLVDRVEAGE